MPTCQGRARITNAKPGSGPNQGSGYSKISAKNPHQTCIARPCLHANFCLTGLSLGEPREFAIIRIAIFHPGYPVQLDPPRPAGRIGWRGGPGKPSVGCFPGASYSEITEW